MALYSLNPTANNDLAGFQQSEHERIAKPFFVTKREAGLIRLLEDDDLSEDLDARLSSGIGLRGATAVAPDFVREKERLRTQP